MKKVLVLGGTRFFGKRLVELLIERDFEVSIATRGVANDTFSKDVKRFIVERNQKESLQEIALAGEWDIVYDQICFSPEAALMACETFAGKVGNYVFTSSQVVYDSADHPLKEEDFNPYIYSIRASEPNVFNYTEGKRMAEAVFFQKSTFPVAGVRFPIVLGMNDPTRRMNFHIEHVQREMAMGIPHPEALLSFISAEEAARVLFWIGDSSVSGPVNACASGQKSLQEILAVIEKETGKKAIVTQHTNNENISPYVLKTGSWFMDNSRAEKMGYQFSSLDDWLEDLILDTIRLKRLK